MAIPVEAFAAVAGELGLICQDGDDPEANEWKESLSIGLASVSDWLVSIFVFFPVLLFVLLEPVLEDDLEANYCHE